MYNRSFALHEVVKDFVKAHRRLRDHYTGTGLSLTLDGKLVGDLAEIIAADIFGLTLCDRRTAGVDCHAGDGRSVQVKATGLPNKGPAFTPGEGRADHLLFLRLNFDDANGEVAYNGPEAPIRQLLPLQFSGTKRVALAEVLAADAAVLEANRLPRIAPGLRLEIRKNPAHGTERQGRLKE